MADIPPDELRRLERPRTLGLFEKQMLEDSLYDETTRPFLIGPSIADFGRGLDFVNNLTNKIPGLNSITDQLDYDSGDFSRFLGRAQEQPAWDTAKEVGSFARGRMVDVPMAVGAAEIAPALLGAGTSTATGVAGLGARAVGAVANLARSHPYIASLLTGAGISLAGSPSSEAPQAASSGPSPEEMAAGITARSEAKKQSALSRRDDILSAIKNGGMISVGSDDNLAEMGIGKTFSKAHGTMAQPSGTLDAQKKVELSIQTEVIPKFEANITNIEEDLRKSYRGANSTRDMPKIKNEKGIETDISEEEFQKLIRQQATEIALRQIPPILRQRILKYIASGA